MNKQIKLDIDEKFTYDCIVVGGGPAGIAAALSSARGGAKTLLIEKTNALGGQFTSGLHPLISGWRPHLSDIEVVRGIPLEISGRVSAFYDSPKKSLMDLEVSKLILDEMMQEANVDVLYDTHFIDVSKTMDEITSVYAVNKSGVLDLECNVVIDSSADGDVAKKAGVKFDKGREEDGLCQPVTLMMYLTNINTAEFKEWHKGELWTKITDKMLKAHKNGDVPVLFQNRPMGINDLGYYNGRESEYVCNYTNLTGVDITDGFQVSKAYQVLRQQAWVLRNFFRKYIPGWESCNLAATASLLGTRESRRINGIKRLSFKDVINGMKTDDSVCRGCYAVDIHNPDVKGVDAAFTKLSDYYSIPYGCLVVQNIDNLLVAGRCISVTHEALGSTRVMVTCMATGEAAGTAAAVAIKNKLEVKSISVEELRKLLIQNGALV